MTSVGLIEGHGTGTPLGDKVELAAIQRVLQESGGDFHCVIGSIKANIGHCKAAAGSAGLVKAIQALILNTRSCRPRSTATDPTPCSHRQAGNSAPASRAASGKPAATRVAHQ